MIVVCPLSITACGGGGSPVTPVPTPGQKGVLSVTLNLNSIVSGQTFTATIALESATISVTNVAVTVTANAESGILSSLSESCVIANSTSQNTCTVTFTGGGAFASGALPATPTIIASSSGYTSGNATLSYQSPLIFITTTKVNGAILSNVNQQSMPFVTDPVLPIPNPVASNDIAAADYICNNDANKPSGSYTYKAMLSDNQNRIVNSNGGLGTDWVLQPGTAYQNQAGQLIGSTTTVPPAAGIVLPDFLTNNIGTGYIWTGLNVAYDANIANCSLWQSNQAGELGAQGQANSTSILGYISAIPNPTVACNLPRQLYCVQQPQ